MKFMKLAFGEFHKISYEIYDQECKILFIISPFKPDFIVFKVDNISTEKKHYHRNWYDITRQNIM